MSGKVNQDQIDALIAVLAAAIRSSYLTKRVGEINSKKPTLESEPTPLTDEEVCLRFMVLHK